MNFPNREGKKNLANLSDEDLANLSPEEMEEAKRARENLLAIKKVDKEVETMENQEKWQETVQAFAQEHGLSIEEAERLLRERMNLSKPSDFTAFMQFMQLMQPKQSPIDEALSRAFAARAEQMANMMFPMPSGGTTEVNPPGGTQPNNPLADAIHQAKEAGAQSLYLPDGSMVKLGEGADEPSALKKIEEHVTNFVTDVVNSRLPSLFSPPSGGGTPSLVGGNISPELAKLVYEDKWKDEDRKAADVRAQEHDKTIQSIAATVGAMLSPEGYKKMQKLLQEGVKLPGQSEAETGTGETKAKPKTIRTTCWKCMRAFPYEEGEEAVCPYCGVNQKVQCPQCDEVFRPRGGENIVCPKCAAELEHGQPAKEEKKTPEPGSPEPSVSVGAGLTE